MKILLVDDSRAMRLIVRRTLREAGYDKHEYIEMTNGREALDHLRKNHVDLVLSDWNMPEMTGIELLEALQKDDLKVKFGFVTSEGSDEILARAKAAGALFLIVKPFGPDTFRRTFEQHVPGL